MNVPNDRRPGRRKLRLQTHDYSSPSVYFLTFCTFRRARLFGCIADGEVILSRHGLIARETLLNLPTFIPSIELDEYCILPDHIHALVAITYGGGPDITQVVKRYKSFVSKQMPGVKDVWKRGFYEHIVRSDKGLYAIREYIQTNAIRHHIERQEYIAYREFCAKADR